jgi:tetratricopeptide (TPR) repeat protein
MPAWDEELSDLPTAASDRLEEVLRQFEEAWRQGRRPDPEDFLGGTDGGERRALLIELAHEHLGRRLQTGEPARAEEYLRRYPELAHDREAVLRLLAAEYRSRLPQEPGLTPEEYRPRFPDLADELESRLRGRTGDAFPNPPASTPPARDPVESYATPPPPRARPAPLPDEPPAHPSEPPATRPWDNERAGESHPSPAADGAGRVQVPGYEVLGLLGRGGMGVVYLARQVALNRLVALKMIRAGDEANPADLARFRSEAAAVARLQHPNIVQIHEVGERDGLPYFSLEYVEGGTLARKLQATPQPARDAARLMETLARAMHVAHQRGIVHRDLKPANVLLTSDGTPKISDFGLAKRLDDAAGPTVSGAIMGTPSYMAPEQAGGSSRRIGPAADVYALGAILYEMLTGRPPFKGATVYDTVLQVLREEPVAPRRLQSTVPRDLDTICVKCLQKLPARRYPDAAALADDLRRFLAGEPIRARPVSSWERAVKWARRRPAQAAAAGALVLALLGGVAGGIFYGLYQRQRALYEGQQAVALKRRLEQQQTVGAEWKEGLEEEQAGRLEAAKEHFIRALATLDPAADPDDRRRLEQDRDRVVRQLEVLAGRQDWQERRQRFDARRAEVLSHDLSLTARDRDANRAAVRRAAPAALGEFGLKVDDVPADAARRLEAYRRSADPPRQVDEVAGECYEVLLVWAEAEAPPEGARVPADDPGLRRALALLDLAAALGEAHHLPAPRAFHQRRARYLTLLGDEGGARAEREQAQRRQPDTALDLFFTALDHYRQGNLPQAAEACGAVLRKEPDHFWAQYLEGLCALKTGNWRDAATRMSACLVRRPDLSWARLLLATAEGQLGEFDFAEADFAEALRGADDPLLRSVALTNRGAMWVQRRRWPEAVADLRAAIEVQPDAPEAYLDLAQAYRGGGDWDAAVAALDQALARRPDDARLYHTRAEARLARGDRSGARRDYEQAIAHEPRGSRSERLASDCVQLAHLQHLAEEHEAALASCDAALQDQPDYPPAYRQRAETLLALLRYAEAGQALDRYLLKGPPAPDVYEARGLIHAGLRQYTEAVEDYGRALALKRNANVLSYRGWAYLKIDATRPALADFEAALRLEPTHADSLAGRGYARVCLGQVSGGLADTEASLRQGRVMPQRLLQAACAYGRAVGQLGSQPRDRAGLAYEDQERAVALLRAALEQVPSGQRQQFWRANVQNETDLLPISRSTGMRELAKDYAR